MTTILEAARQFMARCANADEETTMQRNIGFTAAVCHLYGAETANAVWHVLEPYDSMPWTATCDPEDEG